MASLTTQVKSCAVAGCRWAPSIPSVGTTTLRATRYCKGILSHGSYIRLSLLDVWIIEPLFGLKCCRVYPLFHNTVEVL